MFSRAVKFHSSSIVNHANDLFTILKDCTKDKAAVAMTIDNGPDWNVKSLKNDLIMGRLWRDLNLDYFVAVSYAAGHSNFNMIEHAWSPLSRYLAGVILSPNLAGEDNPPYQQKLSPELLKEKELLVFDSAIRELHRYWNGRKWNNFDITAFHVECAPKNPQSMTNLIK